VRRKVVFLVCLWVLTSVFVHTFGADAETASGGAEAPAGGDHGQFGGPNSVGFGRHIGQKSQLLGVGLNWGSPSDTTC